VQYIYRDFDMYGLKGNDWCSGYESPLNDWFDLM